MDDAYIKMIAKEGGREGGKEVAKTLGVDPDDPKSLRTFHANQIFLYEWRTGTADTIRTAKKYTIGTLVAGVFTLIVWGLTNWKDIPG